MSVNKICEIKVGYPYITEIRTGSAMRIAVRLFKDLNEEYKNLVAIEKLEEILKETKSAFKFVTIKNYMQHVINFFLNEEDIFLGYVDGKEFYEINKEYGDKLINIHSLNYFNTAILPKLIYVILNNIRNNENVEYKFYISFNEYKDLYYEYKLDKFWVAKKFCLDLFVWLNYNQIIKLPEIYIIEENFDIVFPVKINFC